jgi:hypothetical protein
MQIHTYMCIYSIDLYSYGYRKHIYSAYSEFRLFHRCHAHQLFIESDSRKVLMIYATGHECVDRRSATGVVEIGAGYPSVIFILMSNGPSAPENARVTVQFSENSGATVMISPMEFVNI